MENVQKEKATMTAASLETEIFELKDENTF